MKTKNVKKNKRTHSSSMLKDLNSHLQNYLHALKNVNMESSQS